MLQRVVPIEYVCYLVKEKNAGGFFLAAAADFYDCKWASCSDIGKYSSDER